MNKARRRPHPNLEGKAIKGHIQVEGRKNLKPKIYWSSASTPSMDAGCVAFSKALTSALGKIRPSNTSFSGSKSSDGGGP